MGRKKYTPAQWDRFYQGLAVGETTRVEVDAAGINRNTACRAGAEWRKEQGAVTADADATSGIPVSAVPTSPSGQTESAMLPSAACPEVLARAESVDGRGLERIASALETIGTALTALVARLSVSEPSTAQGEPVEPAVAPVQSAHRDNGTGAVSAKSPRSALQEASSRQNGIGAVSPNGNGTGRYPVDTRAEIASISASIDAEEEEAALQATRDAERDAEGEDAFWVNSVWNTMDGEADA